MNGFRTAWWDQHLFSKIWFWNKFLNERKVEVVKIVLPFSFRTGFAISRVKKACLLYADQHTKHARYLWNESTLELINGSFPFRQVSVLVFFHGFLLRYFILILFRTRRCKASRERVRCVSALRSCRPSSPATRSCGCRRRPGAITSRWPNTPAWPSNSTATTTPRPAASTSTAPCSTSL